MPDLRLGRLFEDALRLEATARVYPNMDLNGFEHHELEPLELPTENLPPVGIALKVPVGSAPSPLQLELVEQVRLHFPRLWAELLHQLEADWRAHYDVISRPLEPIQFLGIITPPWEGDGSVELRPDELIIPISRITFGPCIWNWPIQVSAKSRLRG